MKIKRILYFGYYLINLDWQSFRCFYGHTIKISDKSGLNILFDTISSVFIYNISILEYFQFRFFEKSHHERTEWAGTGFMYESISKLNPRPYRDVLSDKSIFLKEYAPYIKHMHLTKENINSISIENLIKSSSGKLILKNRHGQCGRGIQVINASDTSMEEIMTRFNSSKNDMIEDFVVQHERLNSLSPSGLNTLRVITQLNKSQGVDILGVRLRITVDSVVDNLAAGNLAAPVDQDTGIICGPAVYSDMTKEDVYFHPVTGTKIPGFTIPYFNEAISLAREAALYDKRNTSIGWDIAITNEGPGMIEGNHDWCKLLWQLPVKKGLKHVLQPYVNGQK